MSFEILLGFLMVLALFAAILLGFPIAFTLILLGIVFGYIAIGKVVFFLMVFQVFETMTTAVLAAVPLFLFMGFVLEQAGLMDRLFKSFQLMLGPVRGSLYVATLSASTVFAAATGIVGASVSIMGLMAGPAMRRSRYDTRLAAGSITAGGTLGILIPPSVMLVVMGPVLNISVIRLFAAAIIPGLMLAGLFLGYTMLRSFLNPRLGPALPPEERATSLLPVIKEFFLGIVPPAVLILATLGTILAGIATPTEGAAMGAFGAFLLVVVYGRMRLRLLKEALYRTAITSSMILVLVAASNFFGAVFSRLGAPSFIAQNLLVFDFSPLTYLLILLLLIFILGWPLEWVPIVVIVLPIFLPLVNELGFNLVWFGTLVAVTLQTAWLSPPVALSAYFLKGVMPDWDLKDIYLGMIQFMGLQIIGALLLVFFPQIALWLPSVLLG
ncbi:MAG: TRAP transporter large permease subunit [Acidiferrobacterales bacterium]